MTAPFKHASWGLSLALLLMGTGHSDAVQAGSSAQMRVGLTLVAPEEAQRPLPAPGELDFPASPHAVLCDSQNRGYRECRTPFRGPVKLARETAATRCVENRNWGWHEGAVWVDDGCGAVFMREDS
ncbi:DUF3011 domain-containing protein [Lysobacter sp. LF1]|uniref:DUF3011 domain-containing protein n=1 Tax=Lysobacter stagni TaxID=3045172 RepID=A0ABT6XFD8_9GAMM|nr:DUF3011 domain-containing protein [Lysobacter sp. LF1]MDI9238862.1 DUF3011 domain-containing protein [Lysobacter sp. LF1]